MLWTNYHSHSYYSDGEGHPKEYVLTAIEKGMYAYGFSCHSPVPFKSEWNMNYENLHSYLSDIKQLKIEYDDYIILDVCNPGLAYQGLSINKQAGLVLPCKIIVYSDKGKTKVSLYKPTVALSTANSLSSYDKLSKLAIEAEEGLKKVIDLQ